MEEIALGEMGMTEKELWEISPRSLFNKLRGFRILERDAWDRVRVQTFYMLIPHCGKSGPPQPLELMPMPWDDELVDTRKIDADEINKKRAELWEKIDADKKNSAQ
jgi:hypothetical protein